MDKNKLAPKWCQRKCAWYFLKLLWPIFWWWCMMSHFPDQLSIALWNPFSYSKADMGIQVICKGSRLAAAKVTSSAIGAYWDGPPSMMYTMGSACFTTFSCHFDIRDHMGPGDVTKLPCCFLIQGFGTWKMPLMVPFLQILADVWSCTRIST